MTQKLADELQIESLAMKPNGERSATSQRVRAVQTRLESVPIRGLPLPPIFDWQLALPFLRARSGAKGEDTEAPAPGWRAL